MYGEGFAAPEARAAEERARLLVEQVEALGEEPPQGLLSILGGFWSANFLRFNGDACRDLAAQYLALAEKQGKSMPLVAGHYLTGQSLLITGDIPEARAHFDRAIGLYDPVENSSARDANSCGFSGRKLGLSVVRAMDARLSRGGARGR